MSSLSDHSSFGEELDRDRLPSARQARLESELFGEARSGWAGTTMQQGAHAIGRFRNARTLKGNEEDAGGERHVR
jgi:hypothetical protein